MTASILVARALPVHDLGVYIATIVIAQAAGSIAASFASATGYFVSRQGRPASELMVHGLLISVAAGLPMLFISIGAWAVDGRILVLLIGVSFLPIIARSSIGGIFIGTNRLALYNATVHGPAVAVVVLFIVWILLPADRTAEGAVGLWVLAQYLAFVAVLPWAAGGWNWLRTKGVDWSLVWGIMSFGSVVGLAGAVSYFNYRVDQVLVAGLDSASGAGIYSRAVSITEGLWLVSSSAAIASYAAVGTVSRKEAARLTARGVRQTLILVAGGAVVLALLAPFLLVLLFGQKFEEAANALRVLCIGTVLFAPQALLSNYFTIQLGKPWIPLTIAASSVAVNVGLSLVLIPEFGYMGGAWATTVSYTLAATGTTIIFLSLSGARVSEMLRPRTDDILTYVRFVRRTVPERFMPRFLAGDR
ncbi:MAG TPA: polysaccharide biosynthesis C-terminal domain-containing protein [Dehalococcoidia bacterium]|nr:polysaccharide biosynthesis C-terminal domain-containing protein [Dehalococcoidia bacterium]